MMPRVIIPVVALVLLGALIIVCGLVVVPYVVKMQLDTVSNMNKCFKKLQFIHHLMGITRIKI